MKDEEKTKEQLISELAEMRQRVAELEALEAEHKRAERALRESEERFRNIYEESPIGIELYDSNGQLLDVNKACLDMFNVSDIADIKGFKLFEHPDVSEGIKERLRRGETTRCEVSFDFEKVRELELYRTTRAGIVHLDVLITSLGLKVKDSPGGYLVQVQDITERVRAEEELRKYREHLEELVDERAAELRRANEQLQREIVERGQAEEALRESEDLMRRVLDTTPSHIFVKDRSGKYILANKQMAEIRGTTSEAVVGKTDLDFAQMSISSAEEVEKFLANDREVIDRKQPKFIPEETFTLPDGTIRWFQTTKIPLALRGNPDCVLGVAVDITARKQAEEALRNSQEQLELITDKIPALVAYVDSEQRYLYVNQAYADWYGCSKEELVRKRLRDVLYEESYQGVIQHIQTVLQGQEVYFENVSYDLEGQMRVVRVAYVPHFDENGDVKAFLGLVQDITEHKRAEEALRESEASYRELADSIADVFFAMDMDLRYTYWNKASEQLTGTSEKDAIGRSLYELFPEVKGTRVDKLYLEALRTQRPQSFVNEYQLGGKEFFFEINAYPSKRGLSVFVKDITERRWVEEALRESEGRFREVFEHSRDVLYKRNLETGRYEYMSPAIAQITGYTPDELMVMDPDEIDSQIHPEDIERINEIRRNVLETSQGHEIVSPVEYRVKCKDGSYRWISDHYALLRGPEGHPLFSVASVRDITERKRAEEAIRRLSQFRESIIDNVSAWLDVIDEEANVLVWNKAAEELSGYSRHEVVGHDNIWEWLYPDEEYRNEILARVAGLTDRKGTETTIRCKDGQTKIISWNSRILVDENGVVVGTIAIGHDITARKQAEEEREKPAEVEMGGFVSMCASCKKTRDDEGQWHPIEAYIMEHDDIQISHGICPECAKKLYPDFF